jgi:hypothetical protein
MFPEFSDPLREGNKQELFKRCYSRCHQAFNGIYEYEQTKNGSYWDLDERYYEYGIHCYAMAIIAAKFKHECDLLHGLAYAEEPSLTFVTFLSGCTDEVFKRSTRDMGWSDTTMEYYMQDYHQDDAYDNYWDEREKLQSEIVAVRSSFYREERTYLHGFSHDDKDNDDRDNRDFLHLMRCSKISGGIDVNKFLGDTKRHYLPAIIRAFMVTPKPDIFASRPPARWWEFWKG